MKRSQKEGSDLMVIEETVENIAQRLFDQTQPTRYHDGQRVLIPFHQWRDDTKGHFLGLAERKLRNHE